MPAGKPHFSALTDFSTCYEHQCRYRVVDYFSLKQQPLTSLAALADRITHEVRQKRWAFF
jgi:hypothetical protein